MSTHPGMLIAYDAAGNVVATLDSAVLPGPDGVPLGLVDFTAHEEVGGDHTEIWRVASDGVDVKGSKVWPEWLGARAHDFRVELDGPAGRKRITVLIHKTSGHRRERSVIEAAIAERITESKGGLADIRDLVGGPDRPLIVDDEGATRRRTPPAPPALPVVALPATLASAGERTDTSVRE